MATAVSFVAQTPTKKGKALTFVACGVSGSDTVALLDGVKNIFIVENSDPVNTHTVSLTTLPDNWGLTPAETFVIPAAGAFMVKLDPVEFGALPILSYDSPTTLSAALIQP